MPSHSVKIRPWRTRYEQTSHIRSSRTSTPTPSTPGSHGRQGRALSVPAAHSRGSLTAGSRIQERSSPPTTPRSAQPSPYLPSELSEILAPESDADIQSREQEDSIHEVVMAIDMRNRDNIGCCYYVAAEEKMYLLNDVVHGGLDVFATRKHRKAGF